MKFETYLEKQEMSEIEGYVREDPTYQPTSGIWAEMELLRIQSESRTKSE